MWHGGLTPRIRLPRAEIQGEALTPKLVGKAHDNDDDEFDCIQDNVNSIF